MIGSGRPDLTQSCNILRDIPNQYCFQVIAYLLRNHLCRNGSQLIKAAFAEAFLLASRISNLILQAEEEQLQVCIGMIEFMQEAVPLKLMCSQMNQQRKGIRVTLKEYSHEHACPLKADKAFFMYTILDVRIANHT